MTVSEESVAVVAGLFEERGDGVVLLAGSCPKWFTDSGPTVRTTFTSVSSGTSCPCAECTYSFDNVSGDR